MCGDQIWQLSIFCTGLMNERLARFIDPAQRHLDAPSDEAAKTIRLKLNEEVAGEKREVLYVTLDYGDFTWRKTRKMKDVK